MSLLVRWAMSPTGCWSSNWIKHPCHFLAWKRGPSFKLKLAMTILSFADASRGETSYEFWSFLEIILTAVLFSYVWPGLISITLKVPVDIRMQGLALSILVIGYSDENSSILFISWSCYVGSMKLLSKIKFLSSEFDYITKTCIWFCLEGAIWHLRKKSIMSSYVPL